MFEGSRAPYSFEDVLQCNYRDVLRWGSGRSGFSTLMLIDPDKRHGSPISVELSGECNEETRRMLTQLYVSLGVDIDAEHPAEEEGDIGDPSQPYQRFTYIDVPLGVRFTEIYSRRNGAESFRVWAEPVPISPDGNMLSVRNN